MHTTVLLLHMHLQHVVLRWRSLLLLLLVFVCYWSVGVVWRLLDQYQSKQQHRYY